jgi:hypothetical protein
VTHTHTYTHTHTHRLGRTFLDEWSARSRDLYLTTHNTHKRQISMSPSGFEPAFPASERPQTHALYRAAPVIVHVFLLVPDVGLICSNTGTFNKKQLLRLFQLGSMLFGSHLFSIWTTLLGYYCCCTLFHLCCIAVIYSLYIYPAFFHLLPVIDFYIVNHLGKLLFLLLLFILLIISGIPDSIIIKSEYQISFSYLLTIPTTEIIVYRK